MKRARSVSRSGWPIRPLRAGLLTLATFAVVALPAFAAEYVGSEECADCHEDAVNSLARTQHGKQAFANLSSHGCETCHGPASEHVKNPRKKENQPSITKLTATEVAAVCQGCHDGGKQSHWMGSRHQLSGIGCNDCHSVHNYASNDSQLKEATVMDTCFQCHKEIRAETMKTSHHPIREGKIGCNDCHNPHGSTTDKMIIAASVNEQCWECHTEKRGPFVWEHPPVRESCLNCHVPHGSNYQKLQLTAVPYVCQQCHSNTRHPGTLYDASRLYTEAEPGVASNRVFNRACLNCHANIHGTNHPSGPYFGR